MAKRIVLTEEQKKQKKLEIKRFELEHQAKMKAIMNDRPDLRAEYEVLRKNMQFLKENLAEIIKRNIKHPEDGSLHYKDCESLIQETQDEDSATEYGCCDCHEREKE